MTTIRYFIPEDGDSEFSPNVYLTPKKTGAQSGSSFAPRLGDIKQSFPLPGRYHFRFKTALVPGTDRDKMAIPVWMDCIDDNQYVGVWRNSIVAKVTRIGVEEDDDDSDFEVQDFPTTATTTTTSKNMMNGNASSVTPTPVSHHSSAAPSPNSSQHGAAEEKLLDVFDDPSVSTTPPTSAHTSTGNLLDVDPTPAPKPAGGGREGSLLDMDTHVYNSTPEHSTQTTTHHNDFLGMTAHAPAPAHTATNMGGYTPQQPQQQQPQTRPAPPNRQQPQTRPAPPNRQLPVRSTQPPKSTNNNKPANSKVFDSFSSNQGPFGGLEWG